MSAGDGPPNGSYSQRLADPRWQRVRLEVFSRDGFVCRCCGKHDLELHAHHSFYEHGREPWDYPLDSIITYCKACHEAEHGRSFAGDAGVLQLLRKAGFPLVEDRLEIAAAFIGHEVPLTPDEVREIAFMVAVIVWARGDTWRECLRLCNEYEQSVPRYGQPAVVAPRPLP